MTDHRVPRALPTLNLSVAQSSISKASQNVNRFPLCGERSDVLANQPTTS